MEQTMAKLNVHWNSLEIPQPPQTTITLPSNAGVNINAFADSTTAIDNLMRRVNLESVGALCSRLIYKSKLKFRSTKWLKLIEKINAALVKILRMQLNLTVKKISESTSPSNNQLPSQAMIEWFLIKLQGFARLLVRLVITSHRVGVMFRQCLSIGHNWHIIVVLMALASQIWTNCQLLLHQTFKSYRVIHKTMKELPNQKPWSSACPPENLALWIASEINSLGFESADIFKISLPKIQTPSSDGTQTSTDEFMSSKEGVDGEPSMKLSNWEDLGEIISRDELFSKSNDAVVLEKPETSINNKEDISELTSITQIVSSDIGTMRKKKKKVKLLKELENINDEKTVENIELNESSLVSSDASTGKVRKKKVKKKNSEVKNEDLFDNSTQISKKKIKTKSNNITTFSKNQLPHEVLSKTSKKRLKKLAKKAHIESESVKHNGVESARNILSRPVENSSVLLHKSNSNKKAKLKRNLSLTFVENGDSDVSKKKKIKKLPIICPSPSLIKQTKVKKKLAGKVKKAVNVFNVEIIN